MRISFPHAFRIGTDIISCSRILDPQKPDFQRLERLTTKFLQSQELHELSSRFPHWQNQKTQDVSGTRRISAWLGGRWAAKEAAKKAWGASLLSFKDLRVESEDEGFIQIICSPNASSNGKSYEQVGRLSISHDGEFAIATVLATPLHPEILNELRRRKVEAEDKVKPDG